MTIFIDCFIDKSYHKLVKTGEPTGDELSALWQDIYDEYSRLANDLDYKDSIHKLKDIVILRSKIAVCKQALLAMTKHGFLPQTADALKADGLTIVKDDFEKSFKRATNIVRCWEADFDRKKKEMSDDKKENISGRDIFDIHFADISQFEGYRLTADMCTVAQYCIHINRIKKQAEQLKKDHLSKM